MVALPSIRMNYNLGAGLQEDSLYSDTFNKWNEAYVTNDVDSAGLNGRTSMTMKGGVSEVDVLKLEILENDNIRHHLEI